LSRLSKNSSNNPIIQGSYCGSNLGWLKSVSRIIDKIDKVDTKREGCRRYPIGPIQLIVPSPSLIPVSRVLKYSRGNDPIQMNLNPLLYSRGNLCFKVLPLSMLIFMRRCKRLTSCVSIWKIEIVLKGFTRLGYCTFYTIPLRSTNIANASCKYTMHGVACRKVRLAPSYKHQAMLAFSPHPFIVL
jgi:hypothetical protein